MQKDTSESKTRAQSARILRDAWGRARGHVRRSRVWLVMGVMVVAAYGAAGQLSFMYGVTGESHFFDADGVRLHYTMQGEGEPVILLHGFAMTQELSWQYSGIPEKLAEHYQVIGLDQRGHGFSDKPYEDEAYGQEMVRDVVRLMDHLEIPRAHVIGTSMGAIVTLRLVADYPERVISAAPCAMGWPRPIGANMDALMAVAESLAQDAGFDPLLKHLYPGNDPSFWVLTAVNTVIGYLNDSKALAAVARALPELAISETDLENYDTPVLSVIGDLDPLIDDVYAMEGLIRNHEIVVLEDCDHFRMASHPGYVEVLLDFLARHREQPAPNILDEAA